MNFAIKLKPSFLSAYFKVISVTVGLSLALDLSQGLGQTENPTDASTQPSDTKEYPPEKKLPLPVAPSKQTLIRVKIEVKEKGTGKAVRRVEIKVDGETYFSDPRGIAELEYFEEFKQFTLYRAGFKLLTLSKEDLANAEDASLTVYLEPDTPGDNEVIIVGTKRPEVSRKTVSITEAKAVAPRGDPAQVTKLLPGVQSGTFSPDIVVRGSAPEDSRYFVDGFSVPFVFHSIAGISILPEKIYSDISFLSGGFGPKTGEATGGVVELSTKNDIPEESNYQFKVNIPLYSGFYFETPISEKESFSISGRKSYLEVFLDNIGTEDMSIVPTFFDSHMRYLRRTDKGYVKVLALSSSDGLEAIFPSDGSGEEGNLKFDVSTYFGSLGVEISQRLSKNWKLIASPQVVFIRNKFEVSDNFFKLRGWDSRLPLEFQYRLQKRDKLYLGLEYDRNDSRVDLLAPRVVSDEPFVDFEEAPSVEREVFVRSQNYAAWSAIDLTYGIFTFTPGARGFYSSQIARSSYDPRLSGRVHLTSNQKLKFAVGQYSKAPLPQEADKEYGNEDLNFERSLHYIFGWESNWSDKWSTDFQGYYKKSFDVVRSDPLLRFTNDGELQSRGFEAFVRRNQTSRLFGWLSYTYSVTEERKTTSDPWRPAEFDQTHVVNLVSNYSLSGKWSVGGRFNYHTGDRYTPVDDAVYNANLAKYQPRYNEEDRYKATLPDYYQLDVYSVYDFLFNEWKLKLRTGVEYLAIERPVFGVTYNYDYSKEKYFQGIPPIPYIELSGEF